MSQWDKLLKRIKSLSKETRFEELKKLLEKYGYVMKETGGGSSHVSFRKKGRPTITIPRQTPMKQAYVLMVREVILLEEKEHEND